MHKYGFVTAQVPAWPFPAQSAHKMEEKKTIESEVDVLFDLNIFAHKF